MDYMLQLMIGIWVVLGFVGYLAITETDRFIAHRGRSSLGNVLALISSIAGPLTFLLYFFMKPKGPCHNIRCRRIYPLALPVCPFCGSKAADLIPTSMPVEKPRIPTCISGFLSKLSDRKASDDVDSSSGSYQTFHLNCSCGSKYGHVLGNEESASSGGSLFVGPLAFECAACGKVTEIFDESIHGYDAAQGEIVELRRGREGRTRFKVSGGNPLALAATFQYSNGYDFADVPGADANPEDYFDWFSLEGTPQGSNRVQQIADFECA